MTKKEKIKFGYLATYGGLLVLGMIFLGIFAKTEGGKILLWVVISFAVLGIVGFVILHNRITNYTCSNCKKVFKARMIDTIIGSDRGVEGKNTVCPHCEQKNYNKQVRE